MDFLVPKKKDLWIIASHSGMVGNPRFFAQYLLETLGGEITVYLYSLNKAGSLQAPEAYLREKYCVPVFTRRTWRSLWTALQASVIIISHDLNRDVGFPLSSPWRRIINVWHGMAMKKHWLAKHYHVASAHGIRARQFNQLIASSPLDALGKSAVFQKTLDDILITGMPRNDIFLDEGSPLPRDLGDQERALLEAMAGRTLILYAPTWRDREQERVPFTHLFPSSFFQLLTAHQAVFGVRWHERDTPVPLAHVTRGLVLDLHQGKYPETQVILKNTALLITDYSSIWLDFLLTQRPMIGYWYDYKSYQQTKGTLWDLPLLFPGETASNSHGLIELVEGLLTSGLTIHSKQQEKYSLVQSLFHTYATGSSCKRLYESICPVIDR